MASHNTNTFTHTAAGAEVWGRDWRWREMSHMTRDERGRGEDGMKEGRGCYVSVLSQILFLLLFLLHLFIYEYWSPFPPPPPTPLLVPSRQFSSSSSSPFTLPPPLRFCSFLMTHRRRRWSSISASQTAPRSTSVTSVRPKTNEYRDVIVLSRHDNKILLSFLALTVVINSYFFLQYSY